MSKDEYLITDAPLKALTVFAMPMILGSFFSAGIQYGGLHYRRPVCGFLRTGGGWRLCSADECFICVALGAGAGAGVLVSRYFGAKEYGK